jgi:creatinine amidohydrolase
MTAEVQLQRMAWPEIEQAIADGKRTAVIVAASSEQHGPHLPEATDELLGEALGVRLARRLGDALVAPVIRPGCSDHHMAFPGTITISPEQLMDLLDAYIASLAKHGFRRFVVFSSHGGNFPVLAEWERRGPRPGVVVATDLERFTRAMLGALRSFGRDDTTIPHADASETAEMLHTHPDLVHMDRAARGFVGEVDLPELQKSGLRAVSDNGVLGDPVGATAEMGAAVINALVDYLAGVVDGAGAAR